METEGPLQHSQAPATCPILSQCNLGNDSHILKIIFNIILPSLHLFSFTTAIYA